MNEILLAGKFVCLLLSLSYGFSLFAKLIRGQAASELQVYLFTLPVTIFITLQWLI